LESFTVSTRERTEMIEITGRVQAAVGKSGVREGLVVVYVPHTTAAVTINENADPDVQRDILKELNKIVPFEDDYSHQEGNSAAHVKAVLIGSSVTVPVSEDSLVLGTWQAVYFCEFDGPRTRCVIVSVR